MAEMQANIPAVANEWTKYNQVYLGGVGLDTYGILTNFPVKTVDDINGHKIAAPGPSAGHDFMFLAKKTDPPALEVKGH